MKRLWKATVMEAVLSVVFCAWPAVSAQAPAAPRASGTVKAGGDHSLTVTSAAGQEVTILVAETTKFLQVAPGSTDLKSATPTTLDNVSTGDKVLVTGTAGDEPAALHAVRIIVMKSADIAQSHAAEEEAWRKGGGGLVKSVDTTAGTITLISTAKTVTVTTTPATKFRRYSADSVRFEDAVTSKLAEIRPGDQMRVRGTKSEDGSSLTADEVVTGSFRNYSGLLTAVNGTGGTITLKDLATGKVVTVKVTANSDLRRLPAEMAQRFAVRAGGGQGGSAAGGAPGNGSPAAGGNPPSRPQGGPPAGAAPSTTGGMQGAGTGGPGGSARAGMDLSQMLPHLPTEKLAGLKAGDAVMIVASQGSPDPSQVTAITVLAGVDPILRAAPKGEMTLSPWSVGSGAPEGGQ